MKREQNENQTKTKKPKREREFLEHLHSAVHMKATLVFVSLVFPSFNGLRCLLVLIRPARDISGHTAGRITAAAARRFAGTPARPTTFRC